MHTRKQKFFVTNASASVPLKTLLHLTFSRWYIARLFQGDKRRPGLSDFECRRWVAIHRHLVQTPDNHPKTRLAWLARQGIDPGHIRCCTPNASSQATG